MGDEDLLRKDRCRGYGMILHVGNDSNSSDARRRKENNMKKTLDHPWKTAAGLAMVLMLAIFFPLIVQPADAPAPTSQPKESPWREKWEGPGINAKNSEVPLDTLEINVEQLSSDPAIDGVSPQPPQKVEEKKQPSWWESLIPALIPSIGIGVGRDRERREPRNPCAGK